MGMYVRGQGLPTKATNTGPPRTWMILHYLNTMFVHVFQSTRMGISGLFIHFIDYYHSGLYECVAMSTIAQTSISTNVIVQGKMQAHFYFLVVFKLTY